MNKVNKTAVALGLFDGVHIGHQAVIKSAVSLEELGLIPVVFSFKINSMKMKHNESFNYIYSDKQKIQRFKQLGVEKILLESFDDIKTLSAEEFAEKILKTKLNAGVVLCGKDFRFGSKASGDLTLLKKLGEKLEFDVICTDDVLSEEQTVSSTRIRKYLINGEIKKANILLGKDYYILKEVVYGNQIGRTIKFPTINQCFEERQLVPKFGVYASITEIDGKKYQSITNIGVKPTVETNIMPLAETHILNYNGNLYGEMPKVSLKKFIRPEMKFNSIDELKARISKDIESCKEYFLKG